MSTKTRRPVAMATPPPKSRSTKAAAGAIAGPSFTAEEKEQILDNFDLEIADKTRAFRSNLALAIQSFMVRQESEILRIPRELRTMTLQELNSKWGGSFSGTVQRIQRERLERIERERAEIEEAAKLEAEAKGKRKRDTPDGSPSRERDPKTARRGNEANQASSSKTKKVKRKGGASTKRAKPVPGSSTKPLSSLPQNHIFNPLLPPTPRAPRSAKRGESFFLSLNGSPIQFEPPTPAATAKGVPVFAADQDEDGDDSESESEVEDVKSDAEEVDDEEEEEEDDDDADSDGELPDVEAYEARLEARESKSTSAPTRQLHSTQSGPSATTATSSTASNSNLNQKQSRSPNSKPSTSSSSSSGATRKKRGPSLIFRKSMAPTNGTALLGQSQRRPDAHDRAEVQPEDEDEEVEGEQTCSITLDDGTVICFNPLEGDRARIEEEISASGLSEDDKAKARQMIRAETVKALQERLQRWKL